jgi:hypothetical protein
VRLALVSGRPISFRMDLYTPLYVPRRLVEPELFASLRPPSYSGAMGRPARSEPAEAPPSGPMTDAGAAPAGGPTYIVGNDRTRQANSTFSRALREELGAKMNLAQGVRPPPQRRSWASPSST